MKNEKLRMKNEKWKMKVETPTEFLEKRKITKENPRGFSTPIFNF